MSLKLLGHKPRYRIREGTTTHWKYYVDKRVWFFFWKNIFYSDHSTAAFAHLSALIGPKVDKYKVIYVWPEAPYPEDLDVSIV